MSSISFLTPTKHVLSLTMNSTMNTTTHAPYDQETTIEIYHRLITPPLVISITGFAVAALFVLVEMCQMRKRSNGGGGGMTSSSNNQQTPHNTPPTPPAILYSLNPESNYGNHPSRQVRTIQPAFGGRNTPQEDGYGGGIGNANSVTAPMSNGEITRRLVSEIRLHICL